jgi:DNA-3-methyladenine glycosylase II
MNPQVTESASTASTKLSRAAQREAMARAAVRHLTRADPGLGALIKKIGPHRPIITPNPFVALVGSILQQQVSMSAAAAVQKRLKALCARGRVTPAAILELSNDGLRGAGLSRQKTKYIRSLAEHFASGALSSRKLRSMTDEEVIAATTRIKGIGRWTAEMLLIFCLERPDVWPIDDLGLRKAVRNFLRLGDLPGTGKMQAAGEPWRPYRTYASWYLWRSLEGPFMPGVALA